MQKITYIYKVLTVALMTVCAFAFQSCSDGGDDIEEIFQGKTWYVTGAKVNGLNVNGEDLLQFYSNPYYMIFTNNSVSGALEHGSEFVGYWQADGESKTLKITVKNYTTGNSTPLSNKVYDILRNATHYAGDANVLYIKQNDNNYIMLNTRRE